MNQNKTKTCGNCKHWKNKQAELEYHKRSGICTAPELKFNSAVDSYPPTVLDRANRISNFRSVNFFESVSTEVPIGKVTASQYALVTGYAFGCVYFEPEKDKA